MNSSASHINDIYEDVLNALLSIGKVSAPRGQPIREILNAHIELTNSRGCLLTHFGRKLNYHFAVAEWWWIASGRSDVASIAAYNKNIAQFSDDGKTFFGNYGTPWTTQLPYILDTLRNDPASRQAVTTIWRPNPAKTKDVPCTISMQYLIRDNQLHAIVTMRSSDAWLGLPYDVFNFAQLQSMIASELRVAAGTLYLNLGSLHLYDRNRADAIRCIESMDATKKDYAITGRVTLEPLPGIFGPEELAVPLGNVESFDSYMIRNRAWEPYIRTLANRHNPNVMVLGTMGTVLETQETYNRSVE
jgi:thymidylate synthase